MFDVSTIRKAKYFPELLPGTDYGSIAAESVLSPTPLDLRQFADLMLRLTDISLSPNASVDIEVQTDKRSVRLRSQALAGNVVYPYEFVAKDNLALRVYNTGTVAVDGFRVMYGLWVSSPTVADRLKYRWPIPASDKAIADELGIQASVEKGILPLPMQYVLEREYQVLQTVFMPVRLDVPVAPQTVTVLHVSVERPDEFVVLKSIQCSDVGAAHNIAITVSRDTDEGYVMVKAPALGDIGKVGCWIPALKELRIVASGAQLSAGVNFVCEVSTCRLTNLLRARWSLVAPDTLPADVPKKVKGGVL